MQDTEACPGFPGLFTISASEDPCLSLPEMPQVRKIRAETHRGRLLPCPPEGAKRRNIRETMSRGGTKCQAPLCPPV